MDPRTRLAIALIGVSAAIPIFLTAFEQQATVLGLAPQTAAWLVVAFSAANATVTAWAHFLPSPRELVLTQLRRGESPDLEPAPRKRQ